MNACLQKKEKKKHIIRNVYFVLGNFRKENF